MFFRRKKTEGEGINCRDTQRLGALLAGNLTRDGYKPGMKPANPGARMVQPQDGELNK